MTVSKKVKWEHSPAWIKGLFFFWPSMVPVFLALLIIGISLWGNNFYKSSLGIFFIFMTVLFLAIWGVNISVFGLGWLINTIFSPEDRKEKINKKRLRKKKVKKLKKAEEQKDPIDAGDDQIVEVGEIVTFITNLKEDISVKASGWDLGDGKKKKGRKVKHRYNEPGEYTAKAVVSDKNGNRYQDEVTVSVRDPDEPVADAGGNKIAEVGEEVEFDGSKSKDSIGIVSYEWYFDDWTNGEGEETTHVYKKSGVYEVRLIVTDKAGYFDQDTIKVVIEDPEDKVPVAEAGGDKIVDIGQKVKFNATRSTDDVGIKDYEWDFGDGVKEEGEVVRHIYLKPGEYEVILTVTDLAGNKGETTINVKVEGDKQDFVDLLEEVKGIGKSTAERIYENGYQNKKDIDKASVNELSDVSYVTEKKAERLKEHVDDE